MAEKTATEPTVAATTENACPCGSERPYAECCEPVIEGKRSAKTAEELMRSRYSAYAKGKVSHVLKSSHPNLRQTLDENATRQWSDGAEWEHIEIVRTEKGGEDDDEGAVEFIAHFTEDGVKRTHHEISHFKKFRGRWYYNDGEVVKPRPFKREEPKTGRNDPCPCGSGKKFKKCCMA